MALSRPCLMLVSDRSLCDGVDGLVAAVEAAVAGGVDAVQLREKDMPSEELLPLARRLRQVTEGRAVPSGRQALLLVNGPLAVALAAEADGFHLPEVAPPVERPRHGFLIGRSVHSLAAARRAEAEGVDYLIAGPVYETRSHPGREAAGLALIEEVTRSVRTPTLAIGGVTAERVDEVVRAGASGIAVISAILAQRDRQAAAERLRRALDAAWVGVGAARS
ncbi:MAG: thiamine phosphate synthase [Chloroflexi bacterium]|nr:thiamine phosphate synthase [Chloroflexota bacterium]